MGSTVKIEGGTNDEKLQTLGKLKDTPWESILVEVGDKLADADGMHIAPEPKPKPKRKPKIYVARDQTGNIVGEHATPADFAKNLCGLIASANSVVKINALVAQNDVVLRRLKREKEVDLLTEYHSTKTSRLAVFEPVAPPIVAPSALPAPAENNGLPETQMQYPHSPSHHPPHSPPYPVTPANAIVGANPQSQPAGDMNVQPAT